MEPFDISVNDFIILPNCSADFGNQESETLSTKLQANKDCQDLAIKLIKYVDDLLNENEEQQKGFVSCPFQLKNAQIVASKLMQMQRKKLSANRIPSAAVRSNPRAVPLVAPSDFASPYFKFPKSETEESIINHEWNFAPDNADALALKAMDIRDKSFLHEHRKFLRIERRKLMFAVMLVATSWKIEELYHELHKIKNDETLDVDGKLNEVIKKEINHHTTLKSQIKLLQNNFVEKLDEESDNEQEFESSKESDSEDEDSGKRMKLEKILESEDLFKDKDLPRKINWQLVSNKCNLMTARSLQHLEYSWRHILSPLTNKNPWKIEEKRKLKSIIMNMHAPFNWDLVAKELNTQRTPFVCFSRYQVHLNKDHRLKGWDENDNKIMAQLMRCHKGQDLTDINWREVKIRFPGRSKTQIYSHWKYHLVKPDKSTFTECEDALIDVAFRFGFEFSRMSFMLFGSRRSTAQVRERCHKMMRYGTLDMEKWTREQDTLIREHFGEHHSKLRNKDTNPQFQGRSSAQLSMRYHYLLMRESKKIRYSKGLIRKRLSKFCDKIAAMIHHHVPPRSVVLKNDGRPDDGSQELQEETYNEEFQTAFQKLCEWQSTQKPESRNGRPKRRALTKEEEIREIVGPLFFVNLHQTRRTSYPGDGREHSLIQGALYRLLDAKLTGVDFDEERDGCDEVEKRLLKDGVDLTDHLPLTYLACLMKELPAQSESDPLDNLLPPTINTLVGLRGLQLHKKLLETIVHSARPESDEVDELYDFEHDETAQTIDRADGLLLSRLLKLFFWPALMSLTPVPEDLWRTWTSSLDLMGRKRALNIAELTTTSAPSKKSK